MALICHCTKAKTRKWSFKHKFFLPNISGMLDIRSSPQFENPWLTQGHLSRTKEVYCMVLIFPNPRTDLTLWDKAYFWLRRVLNELRLNPFFYYMLFIQATQWQQFPVIGLYQTDFSLELFSPVPEKLGSPPIQLVHFTQAIMGKESILLFYLNRKKCTYECEEEKEWRREFCRDAAW